MGGLRKVRSVRLGSEPSRQGGDGKRKQRARKKIGDRRADASGWNVLEIWQEAAAAGWKRKSALARSFLLSDQMMHAQLELPTLTARAS